MKTELLGVEVDTLTLKECVDTVGEYIANGAPHFVVTLNPEISYRAWGDPQLLAVLRRAQLVTPDGVGIVWACKVKGDPVPERVTGIDLMQALLARGAEKGWKVFLLGAAPGVAATAAQNILTQYPGVQIVGVQHGYFQQEEETSIVEAIRQARPDLLFVALGAPRQEQWIVAHQECLGVPVSIGVGGSFDVLSGKVTRVSPWLQKMGLEWLGRVLFHPSRWQRAFSLPKFVLLVLKNYKLR